MAKYAVSLDDFPLLVETITEQEQKAIVRHEYPLRDGAELENMGMKARSVQLRCHFVGDQFDTYEAFRVYIRRPKVFELVHPEYGTIYGDIESASCQRDDQTNNAVVDITFVEDLGSENREPVFRPSVLTQTEEAFVSAQATLQQAYAALLADQFGGDGLKIAQQSLASGESALSQIYGVGTAARRMVARIDTALGTFDAAMSAVQNPATSILSTVDYATTVPGRIVGTIAKTVERYATAVLSVASTPGRFVESFRTGIDALLSSVSGFEDILGSQAVLYGAMSVGALFEADESDRNILQRYEQSEPFDSQGNRIDNVIVPDVYTVNDIEAGLAAIMEYAQSAIDQNRGISEIKSSMRALVEHAGRIKIDREKIRHHVVNGPKSLHLVCLELGLPYTSAQRLLALNPGVANPAFIEGSIDVYA